MFARTITAARRAPRAPLLGLVAAVVVCASPWLTDLLQFDRTRVASGEWWRLVTGHWTHWTLDHLWWDGAVFFVLAAVCERLDRTLLLRAVVLSVPTCSAAVWWLAPELDTYRGLSGIDSALLGAIGAKVVVDALSNGDWRRSVLPMGLVLGFAAKTACEVATGTTIFVDSVAAGTVAVPVAHVAGLLAGVAVGLAEGRV